MDLLAAQKIIHEARDKILLDWRGGDYDDRDDDKILRVKLIECGWKYSRARGGGWYHPDAPDYPAPRTLKKLAEVLAATALRESREVVGEEGK